MIRSVANLPVEKLLDIDDNSNEVFFKIPPYQRAYAWKKVQWENLFDDINENDKGYFLGSIICINNSNNILDVVDGQQRLATLSILLNAIYFMIQKNINDGMITLNEKKYRKPFDALEEKIFIDDIGPRLTLSIQKQNNEDYEYILSNNKFLNNPKPQNFGNRRVSMAYEYFMKRLNDVDDNNDTIFTIDKIYEYLIKILTSSLVKIEVDDTASAFILFESINNRGIPLTPLDLIKNSIIGKMEEKSLKGPEDTNNEWQIIGNNIEGYNDQVRFLRHYYHAFQCSKGNAVKIKAFTKATKSNIIKIYSAHINQNVDFIFNELIEKSKIYTIFVHPEKINTDDGFYKYQEKLIDLQRLGVAPSYSLLLYLFSEKHNYDFTKILNYIENWFIRRHLTDYPATNKLDQIFLDLINILCDEKNENIFEEVQSFLTDSKRYKSDDEYSKILKNGKLYEINTGATRCLLTKLEKSKRTKENKVNFWELTGAKKPTLVWSIEHIYPQKPAANSDWNIYFDSDEKKGYLHKLGNLTLTCYNSNLSNKSYSDKISIKDKDGKDIGLKSGNVEINKYLKDKQNDTWVVNDIQNRGNELSEDIINLTKDDE